jgi:hypothetical protein
MGVRPGGYSEAPEGADQIESLAFVEEAEEALEVFVVQCVVDIFFQVEAKFFFGQVQFVGGFRGDLADLGQAEIAGGEEVGGELRRGDFGARRPHGEDGRLFGQVPPLLDDIVDVKVADSGNTRDGCGGEPLAVSAARDVRFGCNCDAQGGVTDDEGRVGAGQHGGGVGIGFEEFRRDLPAAGGEDLDERLRAARAAVERDVAGLADGNFADQQEAADALLGGDGQAGKDGEAGNALVLDGGNDGDVGGASAECSGALRGDGGGDVVFAVEGSVREAADERRGVEVLHNGDAKFAHVIVYRPLSEAGSLLFGPARTARGLSITGAILQRAATICCKTLQPI